MSKRIYITTSLSIHNGEILCEKLRTRRIPEPSNDSDELDSQRGRKKVYHEKSLEQ